MKLKISQSLKKICLFNVCLFLLVFSSACVRFDTIRNYRTSFWEGYDSKNKNVYVGKISLLVDGVKIRNAYFTIHGLSNFLNSDFRDGSFAANVRYVSGQAAIKSLSYYKGNGVSVRGSIFIPIKIHEKRGAYYFGDVTIKYKTSENGVQRLEKIEVSDNKDSMKQLLEMVPQMLELEQYDIANEVKEGVEKIYDKIIDDRNKSKVSGKSNLNRAIDSF